MIMYNWLQKFETTSDLFSHIKQFNCFQINKNVFLAPNQHIRMISEWSCDTEALPSHE